MFLAIRRTFKEALKNFSRNGWLSIATVSILTLSLFVISVFFIMAISINGILKDAQENIKIDAYFKIDVPEQSILDAKADLEKFNEVKSIEYISRDQALENFRNNYANKLEPLRALDVIGDNPLNASLNIKAWDVTQYDLITEYIDNASFSNDVDTVIHNVLYSTHISSASLLAR